MVFDPQCLITNRLARAFVGTFGVADCYRKAPFPLPIAVQAMMPLATSATGLSHPVAVFYLIKNENRRRPIDRGVFAGSRGSVDSGRGIPL